MVYENWQSTLPQAEQREQAERIKALVLASIRATSVLCVAWRERAGEPDYLEADLTNGRLLRVYWDPTYSCRRLTIDSVDCTAAETGLPSMVVERLAEEVYGRLCADRAEVA